MKHCNDYYGEDIFLNELLDKAVIELNKIRDEQEKNKKTIKEQALDYVKSRPLI